MLPVGGAGFGYKGAGLAAMVDILCSAFSGMGHGVTIDPLAGSDYGKPIPIGHFFLILMPAMFQAVASFDERIGAFLADLRRQPAQPGQKVMAPGDVEKAEAERRARDGIPDRPHDLGIPGGSGGALRACGAGGQADARRRRGRVVNIDLDGKLALVGGAEGPLAAAIRRALDENGAKRRPSIDVAATRPDAAADDDPFVLVLVSRGANGVPDADADCGTERQDFARTIRQLAPRLKRVVMVFSSAGLFPVKGLAEFSADQAGLASLTRTLAMDLGPSVVVNAVSVGAYDAGDAMCGRRASSAIPASSGRQR